jgi:hypothetical protein
MTDGLIVKKSLIIGLRIHFMAVRLCAAVDGRLSIVKRRFNQERMQ